VAHHITSDIEGIQRQKSNEACERMVASEGHDGFVAGQRAVFKA
jgi:hypothetical protein